MKVIIEDDEGRKTVVPFSRDEITIGREQGNTIRLPERNVSRHHARLTRNNGAVLVEDLDSSNGVRVNGEKIDGPTRIKEGDLVEIGDYDLGIEGKLESVASPVVGAPAGPLPAKFTAGPTRGDPADTAIIRMSDVKSFDPRVEARELQRLEMPRLVGLAGPVRGKDLYLTGTDVTLGRTDDNDIVVDHPSISRSHARFVLDGARWKAIDTRSANGVRINGEQYAVAGLEPGDIVELGHLKFRFCAPGEKFVPAADASEGQGNALGAHDAPAEPPGARPPREAATASMRRARAALIGAVGAIAIAACVAAFALGRRSTRQNRPGEATAAEAINEARSVAAPRVEVKRETLDARGRDAAASQLARSAEVKLNARRFTEAVGDANEALAQSPSDENTRASAWRTLGYANAYLGDIAAAKKYLKIYQPFCASDCAQVQAFLSH